MRFVPRVRRAGVGLTIRTIGIGDVVSLRSPEPRLLNHSRLRDGSCSAGRLSMTGPDSDLRFRPPTDVGPLPGATVRIPRVSPP